MHYLIHVALAVEFLPIFVKFTHFDVSTLTKSWLLSLRFALNHFYAEYITFFFPYSIPTLSPSTSTIFFLDISDAQISNSSLTLVMPKSPTNTPVKVTKVEMPGSSRVSQFPAQVIYKHNYVYTSANVL